MRRRPRRRLAPPEPAAGGDAWLVTYADAVTLLMAFFVLLYAMSQVDATKFELFVAGLADPFGNTTVRDGLLEGGGAIVVPGGPSAAEQPVTDTGPPDPGVADPGVADPGVAGGAPQQQLQEVAASVSDALQAAGLGEVAELDLTERGLVVSIATDDVLFDTGSTQLGPVGRQLIGAVAAALRGYDNQVLVEGHTDDVPLRRPGYTNWNLSTDRAVAVLSELIEVHGLSPLRLAAAGYGEHRPRVPNDSAANRSRNRRVDVLVLSLEASEQGPRPG